MYSLKYIQLILALLRGIFGLSPARKLIKPFRSLSLTHMHIRELIQSQLLDQGKDACKCQRWWVVQDTSTIRSLNVFHVGGYVKLRSHFLLSLFHMQRAHTRFDWHWFSNLSWQPTNCRLCRSTTVMVVSAAKNNDHAVTQLFRTERVISVYARKQKLISSQRSMSSKWKETRSSYTRITRLSRFRTSHHISALFSAKRIAARVCFARDGYAVLVAMTQTIVIFKNQPLNILKF